MAFLRPYKSILQSELVRSSNNSTIPVKYQGEREGEKNFSLQPDSFYSFFPFFLSPNRFYSSTIWLGVSKFSETWKL